MANIQERRDKNGKLISFSIRVFRGRDSDGKQLKPYTKTFPVDPNIKESTARKRAMEFAAVFEADIKQGRVSDNKQTFKAYCEYVLDMKYKRENIKHSTANRYYSLAERIYEHIGHIKLCDIRAEHLNKLYTELAAEGTNKRTGGKLSNKTILEHHRLISTVLKQAKKEGLIVNDVSECAEKPKVKKKLANYYQPDEIEAIRTALESAPLKWKVLTHLLLITGARRGEILGLRWSDILWDSDKIFFQNNILYSSKQGIYMDSLKNENSVRVVSIPHETTLLLKEYRLKQDEEKAQLGDVYEDNGFLFTQYNGKPMHPDSVTDYLKKFSKKHNLPHLNPHAFRHTMASILYYNNVDSVTISNRLGHAQVSTTSNMYSHIINTADKRNAEIIGKIFLNNNDND